MDTVGTTVSKLTDVDLVVYVDTFAATSTETKSLPEDIITVFGAADKITRQTSITRAISQVLTGGARART